MSDFKISKQEFADAVTKSVQVSKNIEAAYTRAAAVNKKFTFSMGGAWMLAELNMAGSLETALRSMGAALDNMSQTYQSAADGLTGTLIPNRDQVFSSVGCGAQHTDIVSRYEGNEVQSGVDTAKSAVDDMKNNADSIITDCDQIEEDTSGITSALNDLKTEGDNEKNKLDAFQQAFTHFDSSVTAWDSQYAGKLDPSKFLTEEMITNAQNATADNFRSKNLPAGLSDFKNYSKVAKNYLSFFGEVAKHPAGNPLSMVAWMKKNGGKGFVETFKGKLSEGTWGLSQRNVKAQITKNWADAGALKKASTWKDAAYEAAFKHDLKVNAKPGNCNKALYAALDAADDAPRLKLGSGLKAVGRNLGYVGDVIDIMDTTGKAVDAWKNTSGPWYNKAGAAATQVLKGAVKIGLGKVVGAAIGTAFGGPAGAVVGMAVGSALSAGIDWGVDKLFGLVGA